MSEVVLASGSPRRRELLAALVSAFEVAVSDIDESTDREPGAAAVHLATEKALAVATAHPAAVVIGSDTIVHLDGVSYGKPQDEADAARMWRALRGREHRVATGVAVVSANGVRTALSDSGVALAELDDETIAAYAASGRPLDKAGAYAIQDEDVPTVTALSGCYCGVMGLPLWQTLALLGEAGIPARPPSETYARCLECPERPRQA